MRELVAWKELNRRKPLLIQGARQVGKTWHARGLAGSALTQLPT